MKFETYKKTVETAHKEALEKLKYLCERTTGKEVAEKLGYSAPYICDVLRGRRDMTDKLLEKLLG